MAAFYTRGGLTFTNPGTEIQELSGKKNTEAVPSGAASVLFVYVEGAGNYVPQAFFPASDLRYFSLSQLTMNFFAASPMVDSS